MNEFIKYIISNSQEAIRNAALVVLESIFEYFKQKVVDA